MEALGGADVGAPHGGGVGVARRCRAAGSDRARSRLSCSARISLRSASSFASAAARGVARRPRSRVAQRSRRGFGCAARSRARARRLRSRARRSRRLRLGVARAARRRGTRSRRARRAPRRRRARSARAAASSCVAERIAAAEPGDEAIDVGVAVEAIHQRFGARRRDRVARRAVAPKWRAQQRGTPVDRDGFLHQRDRIAAERRWRRRPARRPLRARSCRATSRGNRAGAAAPAASAPRRARAAPTSWRPSSAAPSLQLRVRTASTTRA